MRGSARSDERVREDASVVVFANTRVMSDYGERTRRRARLAQFGRALMMILMVAGLAFGAQRNCQRMRGGRPPATGRR